MKKINTERPKRFNARKKLCLVFLNILMSKLDTELFTLRKKINNEIEK